MISFCIALLALVAGYFVYGRFVSRLFGADGSRPTPAATMADGVDYVALPSWKIFLIQFLNIAGLGPIFGAIMGVMFGPAAFLWIVLGTIFAGAVHDYLAGMLSLRNGGASLPELVGGQLGSGVKQSMRVFTLLLMVLVGAVFVYNPADLLAMLTPEGLDRTFWIALIFLYYMLATLLPVDKLIGRLYPLFGIAILFMAVGVLVMLFAHHDSLPEFWEGFRNHRADPEATPIFPMMFVSIACGAISGFHATQSPMMARCMTNERHGRPIFYGAMVAEGIVALIWAAAAIAYTGGYSELQQAVSAGSPARLIDALSHDWLGMLGGLLAILGVIAAPITSGDTALRSARLIAGDFLKVDQKPLSRRLAVSLPLFALAFGIMMMPYEVLWRYFAWCNQVLAVFTLWTLTVWLSRHGKAVWVTLLPALWMTTVTVSYILFAPEGLGGMLKGVLEPGTVYAISVCGGIGAACLLLGVFLRWQRNARALGAPAQPA